MKGNRNFDEVMIVNPAVAPFGANQGVTPMSFRAAEPPEMGYYAEEEPGYGYFAEEYPVEGYGFADPAGYYGDEYVLEPVGYYGGMGWYGEQEPVEGYGYFAEDYPVEGYGFAYPVDDYAQEYVPESVGYYGQMGWYGQPETEGYGQYEPVVQYPGMGYYAAPDFSGYVRDVRPAFNAGCPMPTNVAGFGDAENFEGYVQPATVNATCDRFTPQPGTTPGEPETFRPLW